MEDNYTDGNALAGPLREIFAVDMTVATGRCAGCGRVGAIATLQVYMDAPGLVARCPSCDSVVLRLVRAPGRAWLDLHGATFLEVPLPEQA
jgi:phage FluMu protein Com